MNKSNITFMIVGLLLSGCGWIGEVPLPPVNDENCKLEHIEMIRDKEARQDFASRCFRRGKFKPSPPRTW
jgi:entry exclusion lipoprotein TrbK